jgi:hypothetical protein
MSQAAFAVGLLQSGSLLLATSFLWGIFVSRTPYPRIALSNHVTMIQYGLLSVAAGLILYQKGLVSLTEWQVWLVALSHLYLWPLSFVAILNTWWGTDKTLKVVRLPSYRVTESGSWQRRLVQKEGRLGKRYLLNSLLLEEFF